MTKPPRELIFAWAGLLLLLAVTLTLAYVPLGRGNLFVAMTIATLKSAIVAVVFMKMLRGPPLVWIFAAAGIFWLALLFGLGLVDYATRSGFPPQP